MFRVFPEAVDPCFAFCTLSRSSPCNAYQYHAAPTQPNTTPHHSTRSLIRSTAIATSPCSSTPIIAVAKSIICRSKSADAINCALSGESTSPVWFQHQFGKSSSYVATQYSSAPGHQQASFTHQGRHCFCQSDTEQLHTSQRQCLA